MIGSAIYRYLARERLRDHPQAFRGQYRLTSMALKFFGTVKSSYGPHIISRGHDWTNLAAATGHYGNELPDTIKTLSQDALFIDIGANLGIFSLIASQHLRHGQVLSFEPNPHVYQDLLLNISKNQCGNISAFNCGIGEHTCTETIWVDKKHSGAGSLRARDGDCTDILIVSAADVIKPTLSTTSSQVCCKIDTEGAELLVLNALVSCGALPMIDMLYVEIDQRNLTSFGTTEVEIYDLLQSHDFQPKYNRFGGQHYDQLFQKA